MNARTILSLMGCQVLLLSYTLVWEQALYVSLDVFLLVDLEVP